MAISRGLIDARMDQAAATLVVTRSTQRSAFGPEQWVTLQGRLKTWRDNVAALLTVVEGGKAGAGM